MSFSSALPCVVGVSKKHAKRLTNKEMGTLLLFAHPLHNFLLAPGALIRSPAFRLACSISPPRKKERKRLLRRLLTPRNFFLFLLCGGKRRKERERESLRSRLFPTLATVARFLALGTVIILQLSRGDYPRPPPR